VPEIGLALSSVGIGAIITLIELLFAQHGSGKAWLALTRLNTALSSGVVFGHLLDRIEGDRVTKVCVLLEAAEQAPKVT
jgi:hypothetical protein